MLGLIYTIVTSIGALSYIRKENKENKENRIRYKHPDGLTYIDNKGRSRLLSTDEIVFYTHDRNGDYVLENAAGHVYKNFSAEKRVKELNERKEEALKNNESTYCIDDNDHKKDWIRKGKRFKDFKTGDVYIIRCINYKYYYMNIVNGLIVRKTDWQIKEDERTKDYKFKHKNINIEEFNEKQKNATTEHELFREWEYNYCCNLYK